MSEALYTTKKEIAKRIEVLRMEKHRIAEVDVRRIDPAEAGDAAAAR